MKSIYLPIILLALLFAACKKNNVSPNNTNSNNNNNGNKGGNTGGQGDTLSVSNFLPLYPYTADEVTIVGTGFNADKTKDTVLIDYLGGGNGKPATINSASATQLKIVVPADSLMGLDAKLAFPIYTFEIHANGKHLDIPLSKTPVFKRTLYLNWASGGEPDVAARPGDTIQITGAGFTPKGDVVLIGSTTLNIYKVDTVQGELANNALRINYIASEDVAFSVMPLTIFGQVNDETATQTKTVSFTNGDGKVTQKQEKFGLSPIMSITNISFEGATFTPGYGYSYSLSGLNGSGGKIRVSIKGKHLKNNTDAELIGSDYNNTIISDVHSSLPVSGFPDSTVVEYGTGGMQAGLNYTIKLTANNTGSSKLYGFVSFLMKQ